MDFIPASNLIINFAVLLVCFYVLAKSANFLVDGAVGVAYIIHVPKMIIGIVLVAFATTAPEFSVSLLSALKGLPEIALGNAIGSVIADDALALALGILVAPVALTVDSRVLKRAGIFLITIDIIAFILAMNGVLQRWEGIVLLILLVGYITTIVITEGKRLKKRKEEKKRNDDLELNELEEVAEHHKPGKLGAQILRFIGGVVGVIIASKFLIESSVNIASTLGVPEVVIGLTMIAIGTSLPEIATCIVAARKGHGDLALGDIIGADILNILWIIGAVSTTNPIIVDKKIIFFAFPFMIFVVLLMLGLSAAGYRLQKWKGWLLISVYIIYLGATVIMFYFGGTPNPA
jgi:cation:H+ antiporter